MRTAAPQDHRIVATASLHAESDATGPDTTRPGGTPHAVAQPRALARPTGSPWPGRGRRHRQGRPFRLRPAARRTRQPGETTVRREVGRFALLSVLSMVVVTLIVGRLSRRVGMDEAINDAKRAVFVVGSSVMEPALTDERMAALTGRDRAARDAAIGDLRLVSEQARRSGGLLSIKLWGRDGSLLYADDERLLAQAVRLDDEAMEVLRRGGIEAEPTELDKTENQFERSAGKLLEVYLPIQDAAGGRLLFEGYLPYSRVITSGRRVWLEFAPAVLAGLLALTGSGTLLVASVARRLRRATEQREVLLRHAIEASETERRLIAADLHDGVVQDLTGLSLTLAATRMRAVRNAQADTAASSAGATHGDAGAAVLQAAEGQIREVVHSLRSLIVEIYPPNLRDEGLGAAVRSLCARLHNRGITTDLRLGEIDHGIPDDTTALAYRVVQEAVRNVLAHAEARHVDVAVDVEDGELVATVEDDGFGFDPQVMAQRTDEGHVGLRGLGDLVEQHGGTLRLRSGPDQGTRLQLRLPIHQPGSVLA